MAAEEYGKSHIDQDQDSDNAACHDRRRLLALLFLFRLLYIGLFHIAVFQFIIF